MEKPEPKQTYHSHTSRSTQALLPWLHPKLIFYSAEIHFFALEDTHPHTLKFPTKPSKFPT